LEKLQQNAQGSQSAPASPAAPIAPETPTAQETPTAMESIEAPADTIVESEPKKGGDNDEQ